MDFHNENDLFHELLNIYTIQVDPNVEMFDKYVKYITKDQDDLKPSLVVVKPLVNLL